MDRPRRKERPIFTGFTTSEIDKMEKVLKESGEKSLDQELFKRLAKGFNCSKGRAGKPILKWTEVQSWFQNRNQDQPSNDDSPNDNVKLRIAVPKTCRLNNGDHCYKMSKDAEKKVPDLSELEFEARSSKDGAWYDVEAFLTHRFLISGEASFLNHTEPKRKVRIHGYLRSYFLEWSYEDEWVNVKTAVRLRSLPLEHFECDKIKVGDLVLCFQERDDQARYYDAHVVEIQRKLHDIRGCKCLFLIRYYHDKTEESVRLKRLCLQPKD